MKHSLGATPAIVLALLGAACGDRPAQDPGTAGTGAAASAPALTGAASGTAAAAAGATREADPQPVENAFEGYKSAILARDGRGALARVDRRTVAYYGELRQHALTSTAEQLRALPLGDRMTVLGIRLKVPIASLRTMDAEGLFTYAVDNGLVGEGVGNLGLGPVRPAGDEAFARLTSRGQMAPTEMRFVREGGAWRVDLTSLMPLTTQALEELARQRGMSPDTLVIRALEGASGAPVPSTIWDPPA